MSTVIFYPTSLLPFVNTSPRTCPCSPSPVLLFPFSCKQLVGLSLSPFHQTSFRQGHQWSPHYSLLWLTFNFSSYVTISTTLITCSFLIHFPRLALQISHSTVSWFSSYLNGQSSPASSPSCPDLLMSEYQYSVPFSTYLPCLRDLIQSNGFKFHLYINGSHRCQYMSSSSLSSKLPTNKFNSLLGVSTWLSHVQNRTLDLPSKPVLDHSVDGNSVFPAVQTKTQGFSWLFLLYPRCRETLGFTLKAYSKSSISHNLYLTCSSETSLSGTVPTSITACLQFIPNPVVRMTL